MVITLYRSFCVEFSTNYIHLPHRRSDQYIRASPQTITLLCIVGFLFNPEQGLPTGYYNYNHVKERCSTHVKERCSTLLRDEHWTQFKFLPQHWRKAMIDKFSWRGSDELSPDPRSIFSFRQSWGINLNSVQCSSLNNVEHLSLTWL